MHNYMVLRKTPTDAFKEFRMKLNCRMLVLPCRQNSLLPHLHVTCLLLGHDVSELCAKAPKTVLSSQYHTFRFGCLRLFGDSNVWYAKAVLKVQTPIVCLIKYLQLRTVKQFKQRLWIIWFQVVCYMLQDFLLVLSKVGAKPEQRKIL